MSYLFSGEDWHELANRWGIATDVLGQDDDDILARMLTHIERNVSDEGTVSPELVVDLREFVTALAEDNDTHEAPLWLGLKHIEDDWTFVKYCGVLMGHMWR